MKTKGFLLSLALMFIATTQTFAVENQALQVQGTNLVLSWPSLGNEYYMIQYWPNLQPGTTWVQLTNCYPANSTNRTTFTIPCCALYALGGGSNSALILGGGGSAGSSTAKAINDSGDAGELWATPADGTGSPSPLKSYPPGYETGKLSVTTKELVLSRIRKTIAALSQQTLSKSSMPIASFAGGSTGPLNLTSGGCNCPDMGFFRVWHIPDFPASITNYIFDGPLFVPVSFKDYRERVDDLKVLLDGKPTDYAVSMSLFYNGQTNWGMGIYFDRLTNGTHQIQLQATLRLNDEIGENTVNLVLSNLTRNITVNCEVTFPKWDDLMQGDTYTFNALIKNPDTDWTIDIFDAWDNYVNSGTGHTTNGQVAWTWDLKDYLGNTRDDFDSDPFFYSQITFASAGSGPTTKPQPVVVKGYPNVGDWIVAFQNRWFSDAPWYPADSQDKYLTAIGNVQGGPLLVGNSSQWFPIKLGTNVYSQAERDTDWKNLKDWLAYPYTRNFYYFGHGGGTQIGADMHTLSNGIVVGSALTSAKSKSFLTSQAVADAIKPNRYRFVFLDGCQTAATNGNWPATFGTASVATNIDYYTNSVSNPKHLRPNVFVGWVHDIGGPGWGSIDEFWNFRSYWMGHWANSFPPKSLRIALSEGNSDSNWLVDFMFWNNIRIFGYEDMTIKGYNYKGDWRWP